MKRNYIHPSTKWQYIFQTSTICVGSVHSNVDVKIGGGSDGTDSDKRPF